MEITKTNTDEIFTISSQEEFSAKALKVFQYQRANNVAYKNYIKALGIADDFTPSTIQEIPFLPIEFFKSHEIISGNDTPEVTFESSGTTGSSISKHFVTDLSVYETSFLKGFEMHYGNPSDYCILALLPGYLERSNSSLVYMVTQLADKSNHIDSGFYLNNLNRLANTLKELDSKGVKTLLIGVSFALLDLIEKRRFNLKNTIVMETGGMKGKRKELVREELHTILKNGFGTTNIHSEYGMTELLSQAYSNDNGLYTCPPWMKVLIRDVNDPLSLLPNGKAGGMNIIDLANINSCSFIATQDLGKTYNDCSFEVIGRFDASDVRGCNLMVI